MIYFWKENSFEFGSNCHYFALQAQITIHKKIGRFDISIETKMMMKIISMAYIFTIIFISKLVSVEMACLLGIQNEIQAVWQAASKDCLLNCLRHSSK